MTETSLRCLRASPGSPLGNRPQKPTGARRRGRLRTARRGRYLRRVRLDSPAPANSALARLITEVTTVPVSETVHASATTIVGGGAAFGGAAPAPVLPPDLSASASALAVAPSVPIPVAPRRSRGRQARGAVRRDRVLPLLRRGELGADRRVQPIRRVLRPEHQPLSLISRMLRRSTAGPSTARPTPALTWRSSRSRPTPTSWSARSLTRRAPRATAAGAAHARPAGGFCEA